MTNSMLWNGPLRAMSPRIEDADGKIVASIWGGTDAECLARTEAFVALANASAPPPPAESGWRPMESAPKDGTPILIWHDHDADLYHLGNGRLTDYGAWCEGEMLFTEPGYHIATFGGGYETSGMIEPAEIMPDWWHVYESDPPQPINPIAWQPLPAAPKATP